MRPLNFLRTSKEILTFSLLSNPVLQDFIVYSPILLDILLLIIIIIIIVIVIVIIIILLTLLLTSLYVYTAGNIFSQFIFIYFRTREHSFADDE